MADAPMYTAVQASQLLLFEPVNTNGSKDSRLLMLCTLLGQEFFGASPGMVGRTIWLPASGYKTNSLKGNSIRSGSVGEQ